MLGTLFVQHRIRIVDVDDDTLGLSKTEGPLQHAALAPERKMAHIARRPAAAFGLDELVIFPESAIEKGEVAFLHGALPVFSDTEDAGGIEESLFLMDELQPDDRFLRGQTAFQRIAHIVRKTSKERHGFAEQALFCAARSGRGERNEAIERQRGPPHGRIRAATDAEGTVVL